MAAALRTACAEALHAKEAGRIDEATKKYEAALRLDSDCVPALVGLGLIQFSLNRLDKAIHSFRTALRTSPTNVYAHYNLGCILHRKGQVDETLRHYKVVLRSDFKEEDRDVVAYTHCNMGLALEVKGRAGEAIRHYRSALAMKADCKEAFTYLGAALQKDNPDAAIPKFKSALALDEAYKPALLGLGACLEKRGTLSSAVAHYKQALGTNGTPRVRVAVSPSFLVNHERVCRG